MSACAMLAAVLAAVASIGGVAARPSPLEHSGSLLVQSRTLSTSFLGDWMSTNSDVDRPHCSYKAVKFIGLLNEYRAELGLDAIPISVSMCVVSDTHVKDLELNSPDGSGVDHCGMHSWSDKGPWSSCCFPDTRFNGDPSEAVKRCSWDKPRELTDYTDTGYENTLFDSTAEDDATPESALEQWKLSEAHHDLMTNGGTWSDNTFKAVGAGFYGKYAVMWVGEEPDVPRTDALSVAQAGLIPGDAR